jgi:hypothetical protein
MHFFQIRAKLLEVKLGFVSAFLAKMIVVTIAQFRI